MKELLMREGDAAHTLPPTAEPPTDPFDPTANWPRLDGPPNNKFINCDDRLAGRIVLVHFRARTKDADGRRAAWMNYRGTNTIQTIGRSAKALEKAGFNWRLLDSENRVVRIAKRLEELAPIACEEARH